MIPHDVIRVLIVLFFVFGFIFSCSFYLEKVLTFGKAILISLGVIFTLIVFALLISTFARSEVILNYGVGIAKSATGAIGETKTVGLGYTDSFSSLFNYKLEGGLWTDTKSDQGRKGSVYGSIAPGLDFDAKPFTVSSYHGLGFINTPDSYLGSKAQFTHDVCFGLREDRGSSSMSFCYKHISNAGLFSETNVGRDFIYFKLGF